MTSARRPTLLLFLFALLLGLAFQGSRGLYETTEGRYAEVGREMLESGDWWIPQLNYEPHWTKPPLTYWGIAAGIALAGPTALGARLVNGVAFPFVVLAVTWLGTLLWDRRTGQVAGLAYATSLFPIVAASTISTDLLLTLWEVLTAAFYWRAVRTAEDQGENSARATRAWVFAFWTVSGLAFLTKGPPGLLTLLAVLVFHGTGLRRGWGLPRLASPSGLIAFLVVGFGWYLDVIHRTPGLLGYLLGDEVVGRVATDQFRRNPEWYKPLFVYGLPLGLGLGGWLVHLRSLRRAHRTTAARRPLRETLTGDPIHLFLFLWLSLPLAVLSISLSRLPLYVLPFFAVLPLALARALVTGFSKETLRRRVTRTTAIMAILILALKVGSAVFPSRSDMSSLYATIGAASMLASSSDLSREAALRPSRPAPPLVVAVDESALHGLQFYLGGRLNWARTAPEGSAPSLTGLISAIANEPTSAPHLFVARETRAAAVESTLCGSVGVECREAPPGMGWRIWIVTPEARGP